MAARRARLNRLLIICPKTPKHQWAAEFDRFHPGHPPVTVMKSLRDHIPEEGHVICTYNFARVRYLDLEIYGPWDCLVVDEWHELRGTDAKRTRAILHPEEGIVSRVKRLWALTGTPVANHVGELYPLLKMAGVYTGSLDSFVRRYCRTYFDETRGEIKITGANKKNLPELHKMLDDSGIMLRRLKSQVMPELPPLEFEHVEVERSDVELEELFPDWFMEGRMKELAERIDFERYKLREAVGTIDSEEVSLSFHQGLEILAALSGSISELRLLKGVQKVAGTVKLVAEELKAGIYPKVFLVAWHQPVIEGLCEGLKEFGVERIYGPTSDGRRVKALERFNHDPECRVFVGQTRACGPSVNLTAGGLCHETFLVEQSFVPGENAQAATRNHRIGATRGVRVRLVKLDDPVDKRFDEIIFAKSQQIAATMREDVFFSREFDPIKGGA